MLLHTISGRLVTDSLCQSGNQIDTVTSKVRVNGLTNVTTVNNSFFILYAKSMANLSLCSSVPGAQLVKYNPLACNFVKCSQILKIVSPAKSVSP